MGNLTTISDISFNVNGDLNKIKDLVNFANTFKSPIDLKIGRYCYDLKSILLALGFADPHRDMSARIITDDEKEIERFEKGVKDICLR